MFDKHADEAIEAEIWLKAEAKGRAQGLEEGRAQVREQEWLKHKNNVVTVLREMGFSEEKIAEAQARLETLRQNRLSK
jgi:hypothetical protein